MINYDLELEKIIKEIKQRNTLPTLLLHSCCGPCSTSVIERLNNNFQITILYYNPNIEPFEEYEKRKKEQIKVIEKLKNIKLLDCDYNNEDFLEITKNYQLEPEGGLRCSKCFELRLQKTAKFAKSKSFDYFGTTLTVSPYKNSQIINKIGMKLEQTFKVKYLLSDFKKREGYKRSIELAKKYNLYRQDYCGCRYSKKEKTQ